MKFTGDHAVIAFKEFGAASVGYKAVKAKLIEQGATPSEAAMALVEATDKELLVLDSVGQLSRVQ